MSNEQLKMYYLKEIEEVTEPKTNLSAIVILLTKIELVLDDLIKAYQEVSINPQDYEEI